MPRRERTRVLAHVAALCLWAAIVLPSASSPAAYTYLQKMRTFHGAASFARMTKGRVPIHRGVDRTQEIALRRAGTRLPVAWGLTPVQAQGSDRDAVVWIGTARGAIRVSNAYRKVEYFAGRRWLPDDRVTGIGFDAEATWIETPRGYSRIEYRPMTLSDKSRVFVDRVQARHNRWGLTADSTLRVAGDLSTSAPAASDNDGLWTAMYVAAECFRYRVTGDADARENARRGMQAIVRLEAITGIPGLPARSFVKAGAEMQPADGEWHDSADGGWRWKGDTSSDEIVGHFFVYPLYHDLVADDGEKPALRDAIDRITNHILDHGYQLVDADGKRTRWGFWDAAAIWADPDETGLRALEILSHLAVAQHLTANPEYRSKYRAAYEELIKVHKYHWLTRNQKIMVPGHVNHSDDELAFLSYYPLLRYETNPALLEVYRQSLERSWQIERPERNPLWNVIYAAGTGSREFDRMESLRTLQEIPMDLVEWDVRNSDRLDVPIDPLRDRFQEPQALVVLPYDELPMTKWNGNPYRLDGGNGGRSEDDGAYFLLPYWMARYHGLIDP